MSNFGYRLRRSLRYSEQYLCALPNGVKVITDQDFAVLEDGDQSILVVQFVAVDVLHGMESSRLGLYQCEAPVFGIFARIGDWVLVNWLPFSVDLCSGQGNTLSFLKAERL